MVLQKTRQKSYKKYLKINLWNHLAKVGACLFLVLFMLPQITSAETLEQKIQATQNTLNELHAQKDTLSNEVAIFDNQIYLIQSQINKTQADINATNVAITTTNQEIQSAETELLKQKGIMKEYLRTMYIEGQTSTIELIAESNSFSDFVNRSEYLDTMQQNVQDSANKIVAIKNDLNKKKQDLEVRKAKAEQLRLNQVAQRQAIDSQRYAKNALLDQTKGSESNYQGILTKLYEERRKASIGQIVSSGGTGGYDPSAWKNSAIDPWNFYTYQCTSFAAWFSAHNGPVSETDLKDWGSGHVANGGNWAALGSSHGYTVDSSPTIGSIASWPIGSLTSPSYTDIYGHVAIVTGINGDTITVSEYNFWNREAYDSRSGVPISWTNDYTGKAYSLFFIH